MQCLEVFSEAGKPVSEVIAPIDTRFRSGEINSHVQRRAAKLGEIEEHYRDAQIDHLDGVTISYPNWWMNVRPSNTEPLLRLNVEGDSESADGAASRRSAGTDTELSEVACQGRCWALPSSPSAMERRRSAAWQSKTDEIAGVLAADGPTDIRFRRGSSIAPGLIDVHTNGAGEYLFNRDQGNAVGVAASDLRGERCDRLRGERHDRAVGVDASCGIGARRGGQSARRGRARGRALSRRALRRTVPQSQVSPDPSARMAPSRERCARARDDRCVQRRVPLGHDGA